jgi:hypothetical protein
MTAMMQEKRRKGDEREWEEAEAEAEEMQDT